MFTKSESHEIEAFIQEQLAKLDADQIQIVIDFTRRDILVEYDLVFWGHVTLTENLFEFANKVFRGETLTINDCLSFLFEHYGDPQEKIFEALGEDSEFDEDEDYEDEEHCEE